MHNNKWSRKAIALMVVVILVTAMAACEPLPGPVEDVFPRAQCDVYMEQGCAKLVVDSGGEIEMLSGGTLDLQSGATVGIGAGMTIEGATVLSNTLVVTGTSDLQGNISSSVGAITMTDNLLIDGAADVVQLTVQGYTTQTAQTFVVEDSGGTDRFTVNDSGNTVAAGTLTVTGAVDVGGDVTMENDEVLSNATDTVIDVSAFFGFAVQSTCVITGGDSITPTGTYQPVSSTLTMTTSTSTAILDGVFTGQVLLIVNANAADPITVDDGGNTILSGDAVLGPDDTLFVIWDGSDWVEIAQANNT